MPTYECYRLLIPACDATGINGDYDTLVLATTPALAAKMAAQIVDRYDNLTVEDMSEAREIVVIDEETRDVSYFWVHSKIQYSASQQPLAEWMTGKEGEG